MSIQLNYTVADIKTLVSECYGTEEIHKIKNSVYFKLLPKLVSKVKKAVPFLHNRYDSHDKYVIARFARENYLMTYNDIKENYNISAFHLLRYNQPPRASLLFYSLLLEFEKTGKIEEIQTLGEVLCKHLKISKKRIEKPIKKELETKARDLVKYFYWFNFNLRANEIALDVHVSTDGVQKSIDRIMNYNHFETQNFNIWLDILNQSKLNEKLLKAVKTYGS